MLPPRPSMGRLRGLGQDQVDRLIPSYPVGDHDRIGRHVIEPVALHLVHHPVDGLLEGNRTGDPVSKSVHQVRKAPVGVIVLRGRFDEAIGYVTVFIRNVLRSAWFRDHQCRNKGRGGEGMESGHAGAPPDLVVGRGTLAGVDHHVKRPTPLEATFQALPGWAVQPRLSRATAPTRWASVGCALARYKPPATAASVFTRTMVQKGSNGATPRTNIPTPTIVIR